MEDQIYITIAKVLHGEASDAERGELKAWIRADKTHAGIFEDMKRTWLEADALLDAPHFDAAPAWEKVAVKIHVFKVTAPPKPARTIALPSWIKYSSAIAAILIVAFIIWNPFNPGSVVVVAKNGHQRIELPDHSIIMLRKGSRLSYRKAFSEGERKVSLEGEAFFDVARDEKHPFIIDAQAVSVKVLGTSFNVFCTEYAASVTVATGRVAVASRKHPQKSVILSPGNTANYEDGRLSSIEATGDEMFWMDGKLSFDNDPFEEAIMAIASAKRTAVAIDADLPQTQRIQPVNASFQNQSVEDMLTELCLITNTRWERQGEAYIVRAK